MFDQLAKAAALRDVVSAGPGCRSEAELVDAIRLAEELKSAAAAAQVKATRELARVRVAREEAERVPARRRGRGLASEIGLARRESASRGTLHLGVARALGEMPHTFAALATGRLNEWRATLMARETAYLSLEAREEIDRQVAADTDKVEGWGDRALVAEVRRLAYQLDPEGVVARARRAEADRHVSVRPAPDTMSRLSALLPVAMGVACYAALKTSADRAKGAGDLRSRGQIMADTLVERVTGRAAADGADVEVKLALTDHTLFRGDAEPAHLAGYGTVPAQWARDLVRRATGPDGAHPVARAWIRQLYTHPVTGALVAMASRRRCAPTGLAEFIATRDRTCRTPWCDAPIRDTDHVWAAAEGGRTTADNNQGLCKACNQAKRLPGWRARSSPGMRHLVVTTTPTGHVYGSTAPAMPGHRPSSGETYQTPDVAVEYGPTHCPEPRTRSSLTA